MVSVLISILRGTRLSPGRGHCVVFLGKTLYSHSASLQPGELIGTNELSAGGKPAMDLYPIQVRVEIPLITSCYRNWDINSGLMGHLTCMQTLLLPLLRWFTYKM